MKVRNKYIAEKQTPPRWGERGSDIRTRAEKVLPSWDM